MVVDDKLIYLLSYISVKPMLYAYIVRAEFTPGYVQSLILALYVAEEYFHLQIAIELRYILFKQN